MVLGADDKKWITKAIVKGVVDGINQVMIPYSEEQENRFDQKFKKVGERFDELDLKLSNKIDKLERKLDAVTDHQADKLDNHEKRISRLELARL